MLITSRFSFCFRARFRASLLRAKLFALVDRARQLLRCRCVAALAAWCLFFEHRGGGFLCSIGSVEISTCSISLSSDPPRSACLFLPLALSTARRGTERRPWSLHVGGPCPVHGVPGGRPSLVLLPLLNPSKASDGTPIEPVRISSIVLAPFGCFYSISSARSSTHRLGCPPPLGTCPTIATWQAGKASPFLPRDPPPHHVSIPHWSP